MFEPKFPNVFDLNVSQKIYDFEDPIHEYLESIIKNQNKQIEDLQKSSKTSSRLAICALIVAILSLITTVISIL